MHLGVTVPAVQEDICGVLQRYWLYKGYLCASGAAPDNSLSGSCFKPFVQARGDIFRGMPESWGDPVHDEGYPPSTSANAGGGAKP